MEVVCELYKLLLYEPGGFFKRHRDTEKSEGMFGTLVIQLPSNYEGSELLVYHGSKMKKFDFDGAAGCTNFHYAAFYADCQHEIKPVTKGYRLCLVYNLVYRGSGDCPVPPSNQKIVSSVVSSMKEWSASDSADCPLMMTYLLEHKYCESSLSFRLLKNTDRAVADLLVQARKEVDFDLYVGQVNLTQNWSAECDYGYDYDHDSYETIDLIDESATGDHLVSPNGDVISTISLDEEYFVPDNFFDDIDPDDEEFEEATGNEGATVDKQYNWTALMFWPPGNRIANIGVTNMIEQLARNLEIPSFVSEEVSQLARGILSAIDYSSSLSSGSYKSLLQSLQKIGELKLVLDGLKIVLDSQVPIDCFSSEIINLGCKFGWNVLESPLQGNFEKVCTRNVESYCKFLQHISGSCSQPPEAQVAICRSLANTILGVLSCSSCSYTVIHSYNSLLQGLHNIGEVELISKGLKIILDSAADRLISQDSFSSTVLALGHKYGWSFIKSHLQAAFDKVSSFNVESFCKFLQCISVSPSSEDQKALCKSLASTIINVLASSHKLLRSYEPLLQSLRNIGEVELISKGLIVILNFAADYLIKSDYFSREVLEIGCKYGWSILQSPLQAPIGKLSSCALFGNYCKFLQGIFGSQPSEAQKSVCQGLGSALVHVLSGDSATNSVTSCSNHKELLCHLIGLLLILKHDEALLSLIQTVCAKPNQYPVSDTLAPVCEKTYKKENHPLQILLSHCISVLEACTCIKPQSDWSQPVALHCSCKDCMQLMQFLKHPTQTQQQFKMGQGRRSHLESQLRAKNCSVFCNTERIGTPHTLVVTKTRDGHKKALERDKATLCRLRALTGTTPSAAAPPVKKLRIDVIDLT